MRGTCHGGQPRLGLFGNTPADAGNSLDQQAACVRQWKHPRRCGELLVVLPEDPKGRETPPQMRGTRLVLNRCRGFRGNTPADAGNSLECTKAGTTSKKHPRRCGELGSGKSWAVAQAETPPQMRGTPSGRRFEVDDCRNTPADAGNSSVIDLKMSIFWKHPRRCGELPRPQLASSS